MPQHDHAQSRICHDCDGFAFALIATGFRRSDGTRDTVPVNCPTCKGKGTLAPALVAAKAV